MSLPARPPKPEHVPSRSSGSVFSRINPPLLDSERSDPLRPDSGALRNEPSEEDLRYLRAKTPIRRLSQRIIQDGERTYRAYSADELIEIDSLAHHGRPGMPY